MQQIFLYKTVESDIDTIVSMESEVENSMFIIPNTKEEHHQLLNDENIEHLLLKSENDELIGFAILAGIENRHNNIEFRRIVIKTKGKGYGRDAIREITTYCFEILKCHRLWLDVLESNSRARHLYHSEGFKEEGKLRNCVLIRDKYLNLIVMSMLENEYKSHGHKVN